MIPRRGSKGKLYCNKFLDTGKCDDPECNAPKLNAEQVAALRKMYGDNFQGFYKPKK